MAEPITPRAPESDARFSALLVDPLGRPARLSGGPDGELPDPVRVARRALGLLTLAWRSAIERHRPGGAEAHLAIASNWAEARGLVAELEPDEVRLLRAAAWSWTEREVLDAGWATEGAGVLVWALGGPAVPPHDRQIDAVALGKAAGLFTAAPALLEAPALRPVEELAWMRNRILGIRWRLREFALRPGSMDFAALARERWPGRFDLEGVAVAEGDLAVGGAPLALAPMDAVRSAQSIAVERHRAIEWICGADPLWSRVSVELSA